MSVLYSPLLPVAVAGAYFAHSILRYPFFYFSSSLSSFVSFSLSFVCLVRLALVPWRAHKFGPQ